MITHDEGMVARDTFNAFIAVYILASRKYGTLYTGVTSTLPRRIYEHREGRIPGFTKTYAIKRLVWYEPFESMRAAIQRETAIKRYSREWKVNLIERENPNWDDLYPGLVGMNAKMPAWVTMDGRHRAGHDE